MIWTRRNSNCSGRHSANQELLLSMVLKKAHVTGNNLYITIYPRTAVTFGIQR